jgi:hypothetical protein
LYRALWCALTLGAIWASASFAVQWPAHPAESGLRILKSAVLIAVAAVLLYRRQRDPVAALLSLALLCWAITSSFPLGTMAALPVLLDRGRFLLFALALLLFPDGRWHASWTPYVAIASVIVFGMGVAEYGGFLPTQLFLPSAVACVLAAVASLLARFRSSRSYALRQQLKWVALGLVSGIVLILGARVGAALRLPGIAIVWEAMFQLGIVAIALGFLVSLLRYRLFDAETVISRSATYACLTITLVATFGGTEAAIENLGQSYLGMNLGGISGAMAAAVAAGMLNPLHHRLTAWAEDRFQPDLAAFKRQIPEILARAMAESSTRGVGAAVLPHINRAIHATHSALLLDGKITATCGISLSRARKGIMNQSRPERAGVEWHSDDELFPLQLDVAGAPTTAKVLVGARPDGTSYSREDLEALRSIVPGLRNGLASAAARERVVKRIRAREQGVRAEIEVLKSRVQAIELRACSGFWSD